MLVCPQGAVFHCGMVHISHRVHIYGNGWDEDRSSCCLITYQIMGIHACCKTSTSSRDMYVLQHATMAGVAKGMNTSGAWHWTGDWIGQGLILKWEHIEKRHSTCSPLGQWCSRVAGLVRVTNSEMVHRFSSIYKALHIHHALQHNCMLALSCLRRARTLSMYWGHTVGQWEGTTR